MSVSFPPDVGYLGRRARLQRRTDDYWLEFCPVEGPLSTEPHRVLAPPMPTLKAQALKARIGAGPLHLH